MSTAVAFNVTVAVCPGLSTPPVGDAASQIAAKAVMVVFHRIALCPEFVISTVWPEASGCPCTLAKFMVSGAADIMGAPGGGGGCTVHTTFTVVLPCAFPPSFDTIMIVSL